MGAKTRVAEIQRQQAIADAILEKKTDSLLECFIDDDNAKLLFVLRSDSRYDFALKQGRFRLPEMLRNGSTPIMHAAFFGAFNCVHTLIDLSVNPMATDRLGLTAAHFACAGGIFDICRDLENYGVNFALMSRSGSPAKVACQFGREELVFWLWTRGALLSDPQTGWRSSWGGDPDVLCAAALHGHSKVLRILVESVGITFNAKLSGDGESAVSCACQNGHDEVLVVLFELGAAVNETALPAAIRSGSFKCVDELLKRKVKVDSDAVELATACGHADVLGRLVRVCSDFGNSWLIAWLEGFGDGLRVLEAAGATAATWTPSVLRFLMQNPGRAADFAGMLPPSGAFLLEAGWIMAERQAVIARLLRDGTAAPVLTVLIQRRWDCGMWTSSPFAKCSAAEFENFVLPPDLMTIGDSTFLRCSGLTRVDIPPGVKRIGAAAFGGWSGLTRMCIPSGVTTIGDAAFSDCSGLTRMDIPPSVTKIGSFAFNGCSALTRVVISSTMAAFGCQVFEGCSALTEVEIPACPAQNGGNLFLGVTGIKRVTLVGSRLSPGIAEELVECLTATAKVIGADLAGQKFGRFTITGG
jgi:hypothetical protein